MRDFNQRVQALLNHLGRHNLIVDGQVGPKTNAALNAELEKFAPKKETERISINEQTGLLWCPFATKLEAMKEQGTYRKNYPEGLIVHFTAGHCDTEKDMIGSMDWGRSQNLNFMGIGPTGRVYQASPLNKWGSHAGTSSWPSLGSSVSRYLVGVEIASAGMLDKDNKSWFGKTYEKSRVRDVKTKTANMAAGKYLVYTEQQEESLIALCLWLKSNNPAVFDFDLVLGHDEVSPGRKQDPGGALSMTMPKFRELLKARWGK